MSLAKPDDIVAGLKDYGLTVAEWPGWRTRGTGYAFDPYGQAWHHDAFAEVYGDLAAARIMAEQGRPDLRPPLTNGSIGNFGTVFLLAYGNANHAGRNEADVHKRLKAGLPPLGDARLDSDGDEVVGNPRLWGWECRNAGDGRDPWDQLEVMERTGAAMCDINGWDPDANAGHKELTARKIDPRVFDMHAFRADIARIYAAHRQGGADMTPEESKLLRRVHDALGLAGKDEKYPLRQNISGRVAYLYTDARDDEDDPAKIAGAVLAGLDAEVIAAAITNAGLKDAVKAALREGTG